MSQKANRHHRKPSQGVFVLPDNFLDPLPKNDDTEENKAPPASSCVNQPPLADKTGSPLPLPPAKSSQEMSDGKAKATNATE